jgi:hypothetical protein
LLLLFIRNKGSDDVRVSFLPIRKLNLRMIRKICAAFFCALQMESESSSNSTNETLSGLFLFLNCCFSHNWKRKLIRNAILWLPSNFENTEKQTSSIGWKKNLTTKEPKLFRNHLLVHFYYFHCNLISSLTLCMCVRVILTHSFIHSFIHSFTHSHLVYYML